MSQKQKNISLLFIAFFMVLLAFSVVLGRYANTDLLATLNNVATGKALTNTTKADIKSTSNTNQITSYESVPSATIVIIKGISDMVSVAKILQTINPLFSQNMLLLANNYGEKTFYNLTSSNRFNVKWPVGTTMRLAMVNNNVNAVHVKTPHCVKSVSKKDIKDKTSLSSIIAGLKKTGGDCLVLSAVKSIIPFMSVPVNVWSKDGGNTIDRNFMDQIARNGGVKVAEDQNVFDTIRKMHETYSHPKLKFVCDTKEETLNTVQMSMSNFCSDLAKSAPTSDCSIIFDDPINGKYGHVARVVSVKQTKDGCEIENEDTGQQGDAQGNNTPANPGNQKWSFSTNGIKLMSTPKPEELEIYNSYGFRSAFVMCCSVEAK